MKKERLLLLILEIVVLLSFSVYAADKLIIPDGGGDYQNLTACLNDLNNTEGEACVFNYTSGTNSSTFTLPRSYFNITKANTYTMVISEVDATILLNNTNNITIDCGNSIISGINGTGIWIQNSSNITLKNCYIQNYPAFNIYITNSNNITLNNIILYNTSYKSLYMEYTNNSFFKNINISTNKHGYITAFGTWWAIELKDSHHNRFDNLNLSGHGYTGLRNGGGSGGINLGYNSGHNNFTNSSLIKFSYTSAISVTGDNDYTNNSFDNLNFTECDFTIDDCNIESCKFNNCNFIRNNIPLLTKDAFSNGRVLNITNSRFINNVQDDQIVININGTDNRTTGEFINFNITFRETSSLSNLAPLNYNISIYPTITNFYYDEDNYNLFGNLTPSRPGIYTIKVNMTDIFGNTVIRSHKIYVNASFSETITYYYAINETTNHGQPHVEGPNDGSGSSDAAPMKLTVPSVNGVHFCGFWTGATIDELPPTNVFGVIKDIKYSLWHSNNNDLNIRFKRYADYSISAAIGYDNQSIPSFETTTYPEVKFNETNIVNYLVPIHSPSDWFWLQFISSSADTPMIYTGPTYPSNVNLTYLYTKPKITNLTNLDAVILSATRTDDNSNSAIIELEGDTSTNITIEMPDPTKSYSVYRDNVLCSSSNANCNIISQSNGAIKLYVILGSNHTLDIDPSLTDVSLTPSTDFSMDLRDTKTISCSASNTIGVSSVSLNIDGTDVCTSSDGFCNIDYIATRLGIISIFCTAVDVNNVVTTTVPITATVRSSGSTGSSGSGGSSTYNEPVIDITQEEQTTTITKGESNIITYDDQDYTIVIESVTSDSATIKIDNRITDTLKVGEFKEFDLTDDGTNDIRIKLNKILLNKADISIEKLEGASLIQQEEITKKESSFLWLVLLVALIIIGNIIYFYYKKKKRY